MASLRSDSILQQAMGKTEYTGNDLDSFQTRTSESKSAKNFFLYMFKANKIMDMTNKAFITDFTEEVDAEEKKAAVKESAPRDTRHDIVKDNEMDLATAIMVIMTSWPVTRSTEPTSPHHRRRKRQRDRDRRHLRQRPHYYDPRRP